MDSYIDETTEERFIEDTTIWEAISNIYDMPKEMRLAFFGQISKPKDLDFVKEMDGIYYIVCAHFDREQREDYKHHIRLSEKSLFWTDSQKKSLPSIAGLAMTICCRARTTALSTKMEFVKDIFTEATKSPYTMLITYYKNELAYKCW